VRQLLPKQGIDEAGFTNVGSSQKGEFRRSLRWKKAGIVGGHEKFGDRLEHEDSPAPSL
jgi:hypothetical protein